MPDPSAAVEGARVGGPASGGFEALQGADDALEGLALLAGRDGENFSVGDRVEADLVALDLGEVSERGGEQARGIELVETRARAGGVSVAHGGRCIEDDADGDGGFHVALAHEEAVRAGVEFPVDMAWVVAGLVGAVLAELARQARAAAGV